MKVLALFLLAGTIGWLEFMWFHKLWPSYTVWEAVCFWVGANFWLSLGSALLCFWVKKS